MREGNVVDVVNAPNAVVVIHADVVECHRLSVNAPIAVLEAEAVSSVRARRGKIG